MNKNEFKRFILHTIKENFASQEFHFEEREKAMELLLENGYCESCAQVLLKFVGEILKKQ